MSGATENRFALLVSSNNIIFLTTTLRWRRAPNSQSSSSSNQPGQQQQQQQQRQQFGTQRSSSKVATTNAWGQNKVGVNTTSSQPSSRTGPSPSGGTTTQVKSEADVHVPVKGYNAEEVKEYMRKGKCDIIRGQNVCLHELWLTRRDSVP
jgi:hypothetical protein